MDDVVRLPGLRRLRIYGGVPGIGDQGLVRLKPLSKLEELKPDQYASHRRRLAGPQLFPRLRDLTLFHEGWRNPTFTPAGLVQLEGLTSLQRLELSGGWASKNDVRALCKALPSCSIELRERDGGR